MRAVAFNVWSGQRPDDLRDNLLDLVEDAELPEVLALQECKNFRGTIHGYRRVALDTGHRENANTILLVRNTTRILKAKYLRVDGPVWIGPKHGIKHPPRVFPWIVAQDPGGDIFDIMGIHRTPGGPYPHIKVNAESWAAEDRELAAWFARREARAPGRPRVALGDWNNRTIDLRDLSVRDLAKRVGADLRLKGIDGALVVNATSRRARKLPSLYGSDGHRPVIVTARPKE